MKFITADDKRNIPYNKPTAPTNSPNCQRDILDRQRRKHNCCLKYFAFSAWTESMPSPWIKCSAYLRRKTPQSHFSCCGTFTQRSYTQGVISSRCRISGLLEKKSTLCSNKGSKVDKGCINLMNFLPAPMKLMSESYTIIFLAMRSTYSRLEFPTVVVIMLIHGFLWLLKKLTEWSR